MFRICQVCAKCYNLNMKEQAKIQVKTLLAQRAMLLKDLALLLSEKTGKKYSGNSLTKRLGYGSLTYNEMLQIAEILGYKIQFVDTETL